MAGAQRDVRDGRRDAPYGQLQPVTLRYRSKNQDGLQLREGLSDACAASATERDIGVMRPFTGSGQEAPGVKPGRVGPELSVPVYQVGRDRRPTAGRNRNPGDGIVS